MRGRFLALSALLLAGCSADPPTEVLVVVHADPFVTAHATNLHVTIHGGTADSIGPNVLDANYPKTPVGTGIMGFPQTFGISPKDGDAARYFDIVAHGDLDDARAVEQHYAGAYVVHRVVVLDVWLRQTCIGVTCDPSMTCSDGACVAVHVDPAMLHDLDGGAEAGPPSDGGAPDGDARAGDGGSAALLDAGCISDNQCDDHVFCNGIELCAGGACTAGSPPSCDDSIACTHDSCSTGTDACLSTPDDGLCTAGAGGVCDVSHGGCQYPTCDGTTCTPTAMTCETAVCSGGICERMSSCTAAQDCCAGGCVSAGCDDGNACTHDACGGAGCTHVPNALGCDDGDACTVGDHCGGGACLPGSGALPCDDGNACTDDSCDMFAGCVHLPNATPCDDGNACTAGDVCSGSTCSGSSTLSCNDGIACTHDSCAPASGCQNMADDTLCTAMSGGTCNASSGCQYPSCTGATCTSDPAMCIAASCAGSTCNRTSTCTGGTVCCAGTCGAPGCNDGNVCTDDACDPILGCQHTPNSSPCTDGNACTVGDRCSGGSCMAGGPAFCDDGNQCTMDSCLPATGCSHTAISGPCDDGNPCTLSDVCFGTVCRSGMLNSCDDGDPCTLDSCGPGGICLHGGTAGCMDGGAPCGNLAGQPCCAGDVCDPPLTCAGGFCVCTMQDMGPPCP